MRRTVLVVLSAIPLLVGVTAVSLYASEDACRAGWKAPTRESAEACRVLTETGDLLTLGAGFFSYIGLCLLFVAMGAVIMIRAAGHTTGKVLLVLGTVMVAGPAAQAYAKWAVVDQAFAIPGGTAAAWAAGVLGGPAMFALIAAFFLLFPTGHVPGPRWRWIARVLTVCGALALAYPAFQPGPLTFAPVVDNPLGLAPAESFFHAAGAPLFLILLGSVLASMASVAVRFRRARGIERQQLKWVAASALVLMLALASTPIVFSTPALAGLWIYIFFVAGATLPVSATIAILRHRLYDIDVLVNRALVYGALTAILAAAYFGLVVAFQAVLDPITKQSDVAVAASTLAVAALFGPVRRRVQAFIDRRFYRSRYDAHKTLESFTSRLRDEIDLDHLSSELLGVVSSTMRPRHAALWLKPQFETLVTMSERSVATKEKL